MKPFFRIKSRLAFRLFNLWHTVGFLFKQFLTIGVCVVLTMLRNAVLFLVMQRLPQEQKGAHDQLARLRRLNMLKEEIIYLARRFVRVLLGD